MDTPVDHNSPIPFYVQVKEALRERIERGEWKPGDQLPSETEFCRVFDVSRIVIRQALKEMSYEGLVFAGGARAPLSPSPRS